MGELRVPDDLRAAGRFVVFFFVGFGAAFLGATRFFGATFFFVFEGFFSFRDAIRLWSMYQHPSSRNHDVAHKAMARELIDLHIHVGGAVAPHILWSIAHQQGFKLPVKNYFEFVELITASPDESVGPSLGFNFITPPARAPMTMCPCFAPSSTTFSYASPSLRAMGVM